MCIYSVIYYTWVLQINWNKRLKDFRFRHVTDKNIVIKDGQKASMEYESEAFNV